MVRTSIQNNVGNNSTNKQRDMFKYYQQMAIILYQDSIYYYANHPAYICQDKTHQRSSKIEKTTMIIHEYPAKELEDTPTVY